MNTSVPCCAVTLSFGVYVGDSNCWHLQFLRDEMEGYFDALEANPNTFYNTSDVKLIYSTASEGGGQCTFFQCEHVFHRVSLPHHSFQRFIVYNYQFYHLPYRRIFHTVLQVRS